MQFVILVSSYRAPDDASVFSGAHSAYHFAKTAQVDHTVRQIFFYRQGVLNAYHHQDNQFTVPFVMPWTTLDIPLHVCQTAILEQGLIPENISAGFILSSLTQFFATLFKTDRYIVF